MNDDRRQHKAHIAEDPFSVASDSVHGMGSRFSPDAPGRCVTYLNLPFCEALAKLTEVFEKQYVPSLY
ncbi:hypothetical protein CEXT_484221 [Caerostris extrusa]|uniref:Uncharacterized protein n=1 Tax=Caerostris extrusa TaxID=172846 RepID=A0AAV4RZZ5_CAEEX|nr:hypothetical protein CEXT_484221 [Caerostris extrusa]